MIAIDTWALFRPAELWKSGAARAELLSRADYVVARFSAFSSIFGFQPFNEADNFPVSEEQGEMWKRDVEGRCGEALLMHLIALDCT